MFGSEAWRAFEVGGETAREAAEEVTSSTEGTEEEEAEDEEDAEDDVAADDDGSFALFP